MAKNPQSLEPCWMDRTSALRTAGTVLKSGEYKTVVCLMRSSEGNKFKLSNSLTLPPTDVLKLLQNDLFHHGLHGWFQMDNTVRTDD